MKNINGKEIYGADVVTIINKAIDNNEQERIEKDKNGFYNKDSDNSIKVELTLLTKDEEGKQKEVIYQMENLQKTGLDGFLVNFNLTSFKCTNIEYNKENRIKEIKIKQIEL